MSFKISRGKQRNTRRYLRREGVDEERKKKNLRKHLAAMKFPISFNDETFIIVHRESFLDNSSKSFHGGSGSPFRVIFLHLVYFESFFNPSFFLSNLFKKGFLRTTLFIEIEISLNFYSFFPLLLSVIKLEYLIGSCLWKIRKVWHIWVPEFVVYTSNSFSLWVIFHLGTCSIRKTHEVNIKFQAWNKKKSSSVSKPHFFNINFSHSLFHCHNEKGDVLFFIIKKHFCLIYLGLEKIPE